MNVTNWNMSEEGILSTQDMFFHISELRFVSIVSENKLMIAVGNLCSEFDFSEGDAKNIFNFLLNAKVNYIRDCIKHNNEHRALHATQVVVQKNMLDTMKGHT